MASSSSGMSGAAFGMAAIANYNASRAREEAEKTLKLQCKSTYDDVICKDVCVKTDVQKLYNINWKMGHYQTIETNECNSTPQIVTENEQVRGDVVFGFLLGAVIIVVVIANFLQNK